MVRPGDWLILDKNSALPSHDNLNTNYYSANVTLVPEFTIGNCLNKKL